jgi:hypothetical protein
MNWHPQEWYTPSRLGVDGLIFIEVCALALIAFAAIALEWV